MRKRMAKVHLHHGFAARSVAACWRIARREAEAYQRQVDKSVGPYHRSLCLSARDAADRIALKIRYGTKPQ